MNKIEETFGRRRVLLPVVHCINSHQVDQQADLALAAGADGVFLINQGGMDEVETMGAAILLRARGAPFVGVNLLTRGSAMRWRGIHRASALWTDNAGTAADITEACRWRSAVGVPELLFFGGVAFKYQAAVEDEGAAALEAAGAGVDVVTTSGPATGHPPTVEKVARMRAALGSPAIGGHALAIASGITPENVEAFLPHVDAYLVATGIESSFGAFDPGRVRALADAIHGWSA